MIDIYVAVPYDDPDPLVREERFLRVTEYAAHLIAQGYTVYSPITHSHPMAVACPLLGRGWRYWKEQDEQYIRMCEGCRVLMLPGWKDSRGVAAEIEMFKSAGKIVRYVFTDWRGGEPDLEFVDEEEEGRLEL